MFDTTETHQILSDLDRLARDNVQIQVLKMAFTKNEWNVYLEKKTEGVELKIHHKGNDLMESFAEALLKWNRITNSVTEFRGSLLEAKPNNLDDDIPF